METQILAIIFIIFILFSQICVWAEDFNVGVVLDFQTIDGQMSKASISLAMEDFYGSGVLHKNRLILHERDSREDEVEAASAALDLMENNGVKAIIGPWSSSQAIFMIELGNKKHVPIISFSATSPSLSSPRSPYFIRTTTSDAAQAGCVAAIVELYGWREVVPIYDNTRYGTGIMRHLLDTLEAIHVRLPSRYVIPPSASDEQIIKELERLMNSPTRVFVVHMTEALRRRLFALIEQHGMMTKGFVWIVTESIEGVQQMKNLSMQGVLGCMPDYPLPMKLKEFTLKWRRKFFEENGEPAPLRPSIYSLRAYDTIWAVALSADKVLSMKRPSFLRAMENTKFEGIAGNFTLQNKQLKPSLFNIVNVVGNDSKTVAVWSQMNGIALGRGRKRVISPQSLMVTWPGNLSIVPKGWELPVKGKKLLVGVPRKGGFKEFVHYTDKGSYGGFCIDVFEAVMKSLNYTGKFEYHLFHKSNPDNSDWTYNDFVKEVFYKKYDIIVGDVTISANRSKLVDFSLPFIESGWTMLVTVKQPRAAESWIFMKPWAANLWFTTLAFFLFTGVAVWMIEHKVNPAFRGTPLEQIGTTLYFAFSTSVLTYSESLVSNLSRIVITVWIFIVLILQSSFTANLSSLLTVKNLEPTYSDISQLLKSNHSIGIQGGTFIKDHLINLGFDGNRMKEYDTVEQYKEALLKGPEQGGVAAIFDELPYIWVFLATHKEGFMISGPVYKANGFGFAFPIGSPLLSDVSREVLRVIEGPYMKDIEKRWFNDSRSLIPQESTPPFFRLPLQSFKGLFIITGIVSGISLLMPIVSFFKNKLRVSPVDGDDSIFNMGSKVIAWIKQYATLETLNNCQTTAPQETTEEDNALASTTQEDNIQVEEPEEVRPGQQDVHASDVISSETQ